MRRGASGRRGRPSRGSSARRPKEWQSAFLEDQDVVLPGECVILPMILADELDAEYTDLTLMRTRGLVRIWPTLQVTGGSVAEMFGACGVIEVEGVDDTVTPDVWCPLSDADASWIWHSYWSISGYEPGTNQGEGAVQRLEIDSQAMRRMEAGDSSLWFAIESDGTSDQSVDWRFGARFILSEK